MLRFCTRGSAVVAAAVSTLLVVILMLVLVFDTGGSGGSPYLQSQPAWPRFVVGVREGTAARPLPIIISYRKLLQDAAGGGGGVAASGEEEPSMVGEACREDVLEVHQAQTAPLPNGIPTYTVNILNVCLSGCAVSHIHLSCGWFSSARLINPSIFRRLRYDDCLVNGGRPIPSFGSVSFQYADSFRYPLAVSSLSCVPSK